MSVGGPAELRRGFHQRLAELRSRIDEAARLVASSVELATAALLEGDEGAAARIAADDGAVDATYSWLEAEVFDLVARQSPMGKDLRFLVATLRIAQEVERSGDLVASIARRAGRIEPAALTSRIRTLLYAMGAESARMLHLAVDAYVGEDVVLADEVIAADDGMDDLHRALLTELFAAEPGPPGPMVDLGLVARFYERIADHAVVIAERVRFVVEARMNPGDSDESDA